MRGGGAAAETETQVRQNKKTTEKLKQHRSDLKFKMQLEEREKSFLDGSLCFYICSIVFVQKKNCFIDII